MQKFIKRAIIFTIVTILLIALGSSVFAVDFSKDNTGAHDSIFIAGNPDMYPLEYYDSALNEYRGVLPDLYEKISEETGISFTYIYSSSQNKQEYLATNGQVDIVSAYLSTDGIENLEEALKLDFTVDGKVYTAMVGFTSVCPEEVKTAIKDYIASMENDALASMTVSFVIGTNNRQTIYYIVCIVMAAIILVLAFLAIRFYKKLSILGEKELYREQYDSQTGIYNSKFFLGLVNTEISPETRRVYYAAIISADHMALKKYYSEEEIPELQNYIARTISEECGNQEYCAKGTDTSFLFMFKEVSRDKAAARLDELMRKLNTENGILNDDYKVSLHAGVYELSEKFESSDYVFNIANEACIMAEKEDVPYSFATEELIAAMKQKEKLQKEVAQAIKNGEILYYLQFIVDTDTNTIWGAEAISRWEHPRDGLLMPGQYIELMQQSKTISFLDYYMFEKTCMQLQKWRGTDNGDLHISCNFDRSTVSDKDFFDRLISIASKYDIDRSKLIIEITADTMGCNKYNMKRNSQLCSEAGFKVALDNFGSGSTTYVTLTEFSAGFLKFDRSLVRMLESESGRNILKGLISTANDMDLPIIFEGVESLEQLEQAKALGLHYVQGFYFSRVVPYVEAERFLAGLKKKLSGDEMAETSEEIILAVTTETPIEEIDKDTIEVISIIWPESARKNKIYLYDPKGLQVNDGDTVLVPTKNEALGVEVTRRVVVARGNHRVSASSIHRNLKQIIGVVKN